MRITHKIAAALVAVLVALLIGAAVMLYGAVRPGFQRLEQSMHERQQARVAASLAAMADDLRARVTDYAYWDDTYAFMARPNADYTDDLADPWITTYGLDIVVFADARGRPLWQRVVGADGVAGDNAVIAAALADIVASRASGRAARTGVLELPDLGPAMVSFAQSTRSDGSGTPRGWVIMGKRLTGASLGQQTRVQIDMVSATAPGDMAARMRALDPSAPTVWRTPRTLYALSALRDPFGGVVGGLLTQQPREAIMQGDHSIALALLLAAAAAALAIAALWILLRVLVVRRLERLEAHIRAQGAEPREAPAGAVAAEDEIVRLTEAYNALVRRLGAAGAHEQAALVRTEAEAAANRMKCEFLANVSHELRRPLDAIIGYTELIGEELQGHDIARTRTDLERIGESARRLLTLVGEILDVARIDAGALELRPEVFHVQELVRALDEAVSRDATLNLEIVGELGAAYTDRRRLNQCLANTLLNARDLAGPAPVKLRASRRGDVLWFEVCVAGASLTAEQLAHALDPLSGAHKPSSRFAGSGLALVVTRKLLSRLGGALEVRSTADAATFVLTAAAALQDAAPAPAAPAVAA